MELKLLKDLDADFDSKDIGALVNFINTAPISLQDSQRYRFEKEGPIIHVYGLNKPILEYASSSIKNMAAIGLTKSLLGGLEIYIEGGVVEKVVLHSEPYSKIIQSLGTKNLKNSKYIKKLSSESSSESSSSGESHNSGESISSSPSESRSSSSESRSSKKSNNSGESRSSESSYNNSGESRNNSSESRNNSSESRSSNSTYNTNRSSGESKSGESHR